MAILWEFVMEFCILDFCLYYFMNSIQVHNGLPYVNLILVVVYGCWKCNAVGVGMVFVAYSFLAFDMSKRCVHCNLCRVWVCVWESATSIYPWRSFILFNLRYTSCKECCVYGIGICKALREKSRTIFTHVSITKIQIYSIFAQDQKHKHLTDFPLDFLSHWTPKT